MTHLMSLSAIPNSLDIKELMEVKGGQSGNDNIVCIGVSAVTCSQGTSSITNFQCSLRGGLYSIPMCWRSNINVQDRRRSVLKVADVDFYGIRYLFSLTVRFLSVNSCTDHPEFIIGDLSESTIEQIWQSGKTLDIYNMSRTNVRAASRCSKCNFAERCLSDKRRCVVKVMKAYGKENWDYPDPRCAFAPDFESCLKY